MQSRIPKNRACRPLRWVLAATFVAAITPLLPGQTTPWNTNGSGIWYAPTGVSVGVGNSTPQAALDVSGSSCKLSDNTATRLFTIPFTNTANEKQDFYLPATGGSFWGVLDVEITDTWAYQNAAGGLHKRFYLALWANGTIYTNESRVVDEGGVTADNYAISDLSWNATNSSYKITIVHRVPTLNVPRVKFTAFAQSLTALGPFLGMTQGTIMYDTTVYARPEVYFNHPIGIGTAAPCASSLAPSGCLLSVAGAIQAKEVVVNTGWADYVFDPGYRLAPLSEVAAFVKENHHLPDVPSAAEVQEKGVGLGEMQTKLLAKVEELTLHMIAAEEKNQRLEAEVEMLQERLGSPK